MTITEFLSARIEEDEKVATEAKRGSDGQWWVAGEHEMEECVVEGDTFKIYDEGGHDAWQAAHIARHDPARVLAECAAKRAIIALHKPITQHWWPEQVPVEVCEMCDDERWECETIRALASVYSGHKDYNWREWAL